MIIVILTLTIGDLGRERFRGIVWKTPKSLALSYRGIIMDRRFGPLRRERAHPKRNLRQ
jgi:hypothetical protein